MPKRQVVEMVCDRCGRAWYVPAIDKGAVLTAVASVQYSNPGGEDKVDVCFSTLCDACSKTVFRYIQSVAKSLNKVSPARTGAKKRGSGAPQGPVTSGSTPPSSQTQ